jgi:hypothetical protein
MIMTQGAFPHMLLANCPPQVRLTMFRRGLRPYGVSVSPERDLPQSRAGHLTGSYYALAAVWLL